MLTGIRLLALAIAMGTSVFWFFGGPNTGWTKTYIMEKRIDPVTEQEYQEKIDRFLPGIDFLAVGLVVAIALFGLSFFFKRKQLAPQA